MHACAILDDYQNVARTVADWSVLGDEVKVHAFHEYLGAREAVARALAGFDIVVAMRERTPFDAWMFDHLPQLSS